ncbi:hypothetical protein ACFP2T_29520 [Plantactinospora solaniradicis]|uniref:GATA-type domain-containing protein n=1 Tax=Plantactinospora solaniradicis TaxID=1723736 RepID=A0ABW1KEU6_9ACTN
MKLGDGEVAAVDVTPSRRPPGLGRRIRCTLGLHQHRFLSADEVADPAEPCRVEWRCVYCDRLRSYGPNHDYARETTGDHPCRRIRTCVRCGHEKTEVEHRTRRVFVQDLPSGERSTDVTYWPEKLNCDYVDLCQDCGDTSWVRTEHNWDNPRWGDVCGRCGEKWVGDEA